uniref:Uncharacterized protein n=1 Tax=Rhizophora mucronata TaxID=61149 RepID=A0A2P2P5L5_RHIMU
MVRNTSFYWYCKNPPSYLQNNIRRTISIYFHYLY